MYLSKALNTGSREFALSGIHLLENEVLTRRDLTRIHLGMGYYLLQDETSAIFWWHTAIEESEEMLCHYGDRLLGYSYVDPYRVFDTQMRPSQELIRDAQALYQTALKAVPDSSSLLYRIALTRQLAKDMRNAELYYFRALEKKNFREYDIPKALLMTYFQLGIFAWNRGDKVMACNYARSILEYDPEYVNAKTVYYGGWNCGD